MLLKSRRGRDEDVLAHRIASAVASTRSHIRVITASSAATSVPTASVSVTQPPGALPPPCRPASRARHLATRRAPPRCRNACARSPRPRRAAGERNGNAARPHSSGSASPQGRDPPDRPVRPATPRARLMPPGQLALDEAHGHSPNPSAAHPSHGESLPRIPAPSHLDCPVRTGHTRKPARAPPDIPGEAPAWDSRFPRPASSGHIAGAVGRVQVEQSHTGGPEPVTDHLGDIGPSSCRSSGFFPHSPRTSACAPPWAATRPAR